MPRAAGAVALCALLAQQAGAEAVADEAPPRPSFKRVAVSDAPAVGGRITVRIDAEEQARLLAARPSVPPRPETPFDPGPLPEAQPGAEGAPTSRPGPVGALAWYWEHVSPGLAAQSPGRLRAAEAALARAPNGAAVPVPRLSTLSRIVEEHGADILAATVGSGVSPALALAVIAVESAGRADAVSHAGATGLMQLMPATAARFGVTERTDPAENVSGGVAYLTWLLEEFGRDPVLALAAYNAGEGTVRRNGGVPPYAETRDYVPKVLAAFRAARRLCTPAPQLISDPCLFQDAARLARSD
jgi:hypothetical protein